MLFYAEISPALAARFDACVRKAIATIKQFPAANRDRGQGIRFQHVATFRYYLVYEIVASDTIEILAVARWSQEPDHWKGHSE